MRRRHMVGGLALSAVPARLLPVQASNSSVDLQLVLGVDVSMSIDEPRWGQQRIGYAQAFRAPRIHQAIASGPHRAIAVTLVQWSGTGNQSQVLPWTRIDSTENSCEFANAVERMDRAFKGWTALGEGIAYCGSLFASCPFTGARKVIDISGDGRNNQGKVEPRTTRDQIVERGITINGLPILYEGPRADLQDPKLAEYYEDNVIGGPGAFVILAKGHHEFEKAVNIKLWREIAS